MFNQKLTQVLVALVFLFSAGSLSAQTVLWGAGSSDTQIDSIGRFAADTITGLDGLGWTVDSVAGEWVYSVDGISQGGFSSGTPGLTSPSVGDGVAFFDSDFWFAEGIVPQTGTIISPAFDLTGYEDSVVVLEFYAGLRDFASTANSAGFSVDGGTTWTDFDVIAALGIPNGDAGEGMVTFNVSSIVNAATSLTNCHVRFYFEGDSYYYGVDDVTVRTSGITYDIAIGEDYNPPKVVGSTQLPLRMVNADEMGWGANIVNNDIGDINAGEAMLYVTVSEVSSGTVAVMDSMAVPAIAPGTDTALYMPGFSNGWMPTAAGDYRVDYSVSYSANMQTDTTNDTYTDFFTITADDYLSKVGRDLTGFPTADSGTLPGVRSADGFLPAEHEWGSMYYIPNYTVTNGDSIVADSFLYTGATANAATGVTEAVVQVRLYKFNDDDGSGFWTAQPTGPSDPELPIQALGVDTFTLDAAATFRQRAVALSNLNGGTGAVLQPNSFYVATILCSDQINGLRDANNSTRHIFIGNSEDKYDFTIDSMPNYFIPASIVRSAYIDPTGTVTGLQDNQWFGAGYASGIVPSIGLTLTDAITVNVTANEAVTTEFNIFPNPATEQISAKVELTEMNSNVEYIITDATGRVVIKEQKADLQSDVVTYDVSQLPAGVYFFTVRTAQGASSQKFVKQ